MLYVGNSIPLTDGEISLIQSLTGAFATAYARYDDFVRLEAAKQEVDRTLSELKAAQSQLIQSEKMASLGELTAGIAHEIQNPLNFVNNFSEVNIELIDEMKTELAEGNHPAATALSDDIRQNLEKINFHGKRADSIVKNMLQHSRKSTGQKEAADINALTDEYLRLCYHGLRAKEKWFNVKLETQYAEELPKARIVTQDIGRVLLNLFTNAFYSLMQKAKKEGEGFQPLIRVVTAQSKDMIEIRIRDNGIGIPASVLDKIYHPFFTTKPAGDGTGLGLSLSYDIITKEHSGTIEVATAEGEYAEFILRLPV
jgi:C4-dicarboxylate-specific signal transduction histidine kinase